MDCVDVGTKNPKTLITVYARESLSKSDPQFLRDLPDWGLVDNGDGTCDAVVPGRDVRDHLEVLEGAFGPCSFS